MTVSTWISLAVFVVNLMVIVFAAGKFSEKIKQQEIKIEENKKAYKELIEGNKQDYKNLIAGVNKRLDKISEMSHGEGGRTVFVTRIEYENDKKTMMQLSNERKDLMCDLFDKLDDRMERLENSIDKIRG